MRLLLVRLKRPQCQTQTEKQLSGASSCWKGGRIGFRGIYTHNNRKHNQCPILACHIDKDLQHGLAVLARQRGLPVLDREEEGHEHEEAEQGREADARDDADGGAPGCFAGFFAEVGGGLRIS